MNDRRNENGEIRLTCLKKTISIENDDHGLIEIMPVLILPSTPLIPIHPPILILIPPPLRITMTMITMMMLIVMTPLILLITMMMIKNDDAALRIVENLRL